MSESGESGELRRFRDAWADRSTYVWASRGAFGRSWDAAGICERRVGSTSAGADVWDEPLRLYLPDGSRSLVIPEWLALPWVVRAIARLLL